MMNDLSSHQNKPLNPADFDPLIHRKHWSRFVNIFFVVATFSILMTTYYFMYYDNEFYYIVLPWTFVFQPYNFIY